jgi:hypothetical protein
MASWSHGGRFYGGWWQTIAEEERKAILIDGKPTVERDFTGMHVRMLYKLKTGIDYQDDPYSLDGYGSECRRVLKKIMQASSMPIAKLRALRAMQMEKLRNSGDFPDGLDVSRAIDDLVAKHHGLSECFFKGQDGTRNAKQWMPTSPIGCCSIWQDKESTALPIHGQLHRDRGARQSVIAAMNRALKA